MNMCTKVMVLAMMGMAAYAYGAEEKKTLKFRIQRDAKEITQSELQYPEEKYTFVWEYSEKLKDVKNEKEVEFKQGERLSEEVAIEDLQKRALHRVRPGTGYIKRITIYPFSKKAIDKSDIKYGKLVNSENLQDLNKELDAATRELDNVEFSLSYLGDEYEVAIVVD